MASISKIKYIDKLDIVNECNNGYHNIIKMKPADVKSQVNTLTLVWKIMIKILSLKLASM